MHECNHPLSFDSEIQSGPWPAFPIAFPIASERMTTGRLALDHSPQMSKHLVWMLDWRGFKQRAAALRARIIGLKFRKSDAASVARGIVAELRGTGHQRSDGGQGV